MLIVRWKIYKEHICKEKVVGKGRTGQETRTREIVQWGKKKTISHTALSEARLCVNVWLAFGRQPWQIALLGWQPGSLSTRSSHLRAATHRDCTLYHILLCLLFFTILFCLALSTRSAEDNVTRGWMNGWMGMRATGGQCFFEIEPINSRHSCCWTYIARLSVYWPNVVGKIVYPFIHLSSIVIFIINLAVFMEKIISSLNYIEWRNFIFFFISKFYLYFSGI